MSRNKREYEICKSIATYVRAQYPNAIFHFDLAGLNLSRAQAGMMKTIQGQRGFPDLHILEPRGVYRGFFLEIKKEDTKLFKLNGEFVSDEHLNEQRIMLEAIEKKGYYARFAIGFDRAKLHIDTYMEL